MASYGEVIGNKIPVKVQLLLRWYKFMKFFIVRFYYSNGSDLQALSNIKHSGIAYKSAKTIWIISFGIRNDLLLKSKSLIYCNITM